VNAAYADVFPDPKPARATVQAGLVVGQVEID
jgi:enamine deaminase RidA (YjgF/YER057c/UK114 family)